MPCATSSHTGESTESLRHLKRELDKLYARYNHREFVHPDPLEFVLEYDDPCDQEIVGMIASSLAFGGVAQILNSVALVLKHMPGPARYLRDASPSRMWRAFEGFRHRFVTGRELCGLLTGMRRVIEEHGSLGACFAQGLDDKHDTVLPALDTFVGQLRAVSGLSENYLLPLPARGSACKRLNLFLRWMVRRDEVDPGLWAAVPASKLIMPLDTHIHRIALAVGLTERRQGNMRTALEITEAFRKIAPDDPVKYDFALTRLAMRKDADLEEFLTKCGG